jgi:hypothetical protein
MEEIIAKEVPGLVIFAAFALAMWRVYSVSSQKKDEHFIATLEKKDKQFTETLKLYGQEILGHVIDIKDLVEDRPKSKKKERFGLGD